MKAPFMDLQQQYQSLSEEILPGVERVMERCSFILGDEVSEFEQEFAHFCGVRECVGVGSGCDALLLAMRAAGIGPGDEVIVPSNTFIATALAVTAAGASLVLVDCLPGTYLIDPQAIATAITPRTKAVVPVHLYGQPADMKEIKAVADEAGLVIIEDAAQAHGATYAGERCGSMGLAGCFSFYPGKNLGAYGDGGAITTNDPALAGELRMARNYGQSRKYHHDVVGWNTRLDSIQSVVLKAKLDRLDEWSERRRQNAALYQKKLQGVPIVLPECGEDREHVYHLYVILSERRDELLSFLNGKGISCGMHYPIPIHLQEAYTHLGCEGGSFPQSEHVAKRLLSLPMFPELTEMQIDYVCDSIHSFFE